MIVKYIKYLNHLLYLVGTLSLSLIAIACEDYLEVEDPVGQISMEAVYENENTATAAVTSLYAKLRDDVILTGGSMGMGVLMGLYSDELDYYGSPGGNMEKFYNHQIIASNPTVSSIWNDSYNLIYMCNAAVEGLEGSKSLSDEIKKQLVGESLFIRGLVHFYLVNIFGDLPYIKTTNYLDNSSVKRMPVEIIYQNIVSDLLEARNSLGSEYPSAEKTRANKNVVSALLARVYLYSEQWEKAEYESNLLINNMADFSLEADIQNEFLKDSSSSIFHLKPKNNGDNTLEGSTFIFSTGPPPLLAVNIGFLNAMEDIDLRKQYWIKEIREGEDSWFHPFKYKLNLNTGSSMEYSVVLRISEQYLIRGEARLRTGNLLGAVDDINVIRERAGLENLGASGPEELLKAILRERRFELFSEFGHRWFDLRRTGFAEQVLSPLKLGWKYSDILLPIPESELLMNPSLEPQNPGY